MRGRERKRGERKVESERGRGEGKAIRASDAISGVERNINIVSNILYASMVVVQRWSFIRELLPLLSLHLNASKTKLKSKGRIYFFSSMKSKRGIFFSQSRFQCLQLLLS